MKRAFVIALAIHLCVLLGAGYIYVLPPEKREKLFEMVNIKRPKPAVKKVRIIPPKKIRKPLPRPVKRRAAKPIQLIAARTDIVPEFTISLPEPSQAVYTPEVALVRLPEPVIEEPGGGFWGKEIEMKEKEIELESFGLQNLQPVGTVENPVTNIVVRFTERQTCCSAEVGLLYPEKRELYRWAGEGYGPVSVPPVALGPYAVAPEEFVFYFRPFDCVCSGEMYLSTEGMPRVDVHPLGPNTIQYIWEDLPENLMQPGDSMDLWMEVTFIGAQGGF